MKAFSKAEVAAVLKKLFQCEIFFMEFYVESEEHARDQNHTRTIKKKRKEIVAFVEVEQTPFTLRC